jgi:tight adherence protein C
MSGTGALIGGLAAVGGWLVVSRLPARRRPTLDQRLAPYLVTRPGTDPAGWRDARRTWTPGVLERLLQPVMADVVRWIERAGGGSGSVLRRLDQLGERVTLDQVRAQQVVCGVLGALVGAGLALLGTVAGRGPSVVPALGLIVVGALTGVLGRDQLLSRQVRRREERMLAEFPALAELLALAVGAGESALGALERVARTGHGELPAELARTLDDVRTGTPFAVAMEGLAARTDLPSLARFADGVAVALERGTPLGDVLRAQAQDVRELGRRRLMEAGGRREILMMVPVVFLVLPVTVLFAVYPGLAVLDLQP